MARQGQRSRDAGLPPTTDAFTPYDEEHMALYMSLLHARAEGVPDAEIARTLFGIDAAAEPEHVRLSIEAHRRRAVWLAGPGRRHLIEETDPNLSPDRR